MAARTGKLLADLADWRYALILSAILHGLLLFLFVFVRVSFEFQVPEFVEVAFVSGQLEPTGGASAARAAVEETAEPAPTATAAAQRGEGEQIVALPRRRMRKEEEPLVRATDEGKLTPTETLAAAIPEKIREPAPSRVPVDQQLLRGNLEKIGPKVNRPLPEAKPTARPTSAAGTTPGEPFVITGEAAQRTILYKVIPKYPEGVNKEAVIRIRFTVLPSGLVGTAVLLTKGGDATLERLTLDAFRQWRFNALPEDVPQVEQEGVITFRWILR